MVVLFRVVPFLRGIDVGVDGAVVGFLDGLDLRARGGILLGRGGPDGLLYCTLGLYPLGLCSSKKWSKSWS